MTARFDLVHRAKPYSRWTT